MWVQWNEYDAYFRQLLATEKAMNPEISWLDAIADRFEADCKAGKRPTLEHYLETTSDQQRARLFGELLHLEVHYRRLRNERPSIEEYEARFPDQSEVIRAVLGPSEHRAETTRLEANVRPAGSFTQVGPYVIEREIGRGGMGVVLCGRDPQFERRLAVKVLQAHPANEPDLARRFQEEAQIMGRVQHPGVPPVHERGVLEDGRPFFSMKLIQGHTLAELLWQRQQPGQDLSRFVSILEQVCQTLAYAHSQGIIHRDLKPANIMVGAFGEVQVMDWGLAKSLPSASNEPAEHHDRACLVRLANICTNTAAGQVMGTLGYMPPEQGRGEVAQLDERSDVFALGAILCEILTGKPAFHGGSSRDLLRRCSEGRLDDAWQRLEQCGADAELIALAKNCLAANRDDRPRHAGVVAKALENYQAFVRERLRNAELAKAQAEVQAVEERKRRQVEEAKAREERRRRRSQLALAAAILLLVVGGSAGAYWFRQMATERREAETKRRAELAQQQVANEGRVRQRLDQTKQILSELHKKMDTARDLAQLLDDPDAWRAQINAAAAELKQAQLLQRANRIDPLLARDIDVLAAQLGQEPHLLAVALDLDVAREEFTKKDKDTAAAVRNYKDIFSRLHLNVEQDTPEEMAGAIRQSPIRHQLAAALDDLAFAVTEEKQADLGQRLRRTAQLADPAPWRDRLLDSQTNQITVGNLGAELLQDPERFDKLSPQSLYVLHAFMPVGSEIRERFLRRAYSRYPNDFLLSLALGFDHAQNKRYSEAASFYRGAVAVRPKNVTAWIKLGEALLANKDFSGCIDAFTTATDIDPDNALAWSSLGNALADNHESAAAIDAFKKSLAIDPAKSVIWSLLGARLQNIQDFAGAVKAQKEAIALDEQSTGAWIFLGAALVGSKDFAGAIDAYRRAATLDEQNVTTWYQLGNALLASGDVTGAITAYNRALDLNNQLANAWLGLGDALIAKNDMGAAIDAYKKAVVIAKTKPALYRLQNALTKAEGLADALDAWYTLGLAFHERNDLPAAVEAYERALALDNNDPGIWFALGNALQAAGITDRAVDAYKRAIAIDPRDADVWSSLAGMLYAQGDHGGAINAYRKILSIHPHMAMTHANLAFPLRDQGQFALAVASLERALKLTPVAAKVSS